MTRRALLQLLWCLPLPLVVITKQNPHACLSHSLEGILRIIERDPDLQVDDNIQFPRTPTPALSS